jgi:nucleotide-binding universal stress UspA family protein
VPSTFSTNPAAAIQLRARVSPQGAIMTSIVVGIDGSDPANEALRWAIAEARLRSAMLTIVHAWEFPTVVNAWAVEPFIVAGMEEAARAILDGAIAAARHENPDLDIEGRLVHGSPAVVLLGAASGADVVVVGARGLGGFAGLMLGSVGRQVAHHSSRPVAIIHPRRADRPGVSHGRVVVGVDGSPTSIRALRFALDEAEARHAELRVVHAWTFPALTILPAVPDVPTPDQLAADARALIERCLDKAGGPGDVSVDCAVPQGHTAQALLDAAADCDVVVVGARGIGGFRGLLVGSIADACVSHARLPVIIVPAA